MHRLFGSVKYNFNINITTLNVRVYDDGGIYEWIQNRVCIRFEYYVQSYRYIRLSHLSRCAVTGVECTIICTIQIVKDENICLLPNYTTYWKLTHCFRVTFTVIRDFHVAIKMCQIKCNFIFCQTKCSTWYARRVNSHRHLN